MKYISFIVPCYNSQEYLERCVRSLLPGGEDVEILIVNDGSTDATGEIGEWLAKSHPGIVRVVHKPNGGHGSGINLGLKLAVGLYFKVVDSDDWLEEGALGQLLERLPFCISKAFKLLPIILEKIILMLVYLNILITLSPSTTSSLSCSVIRKMFPMLCRSSEES